MPENYPASLQDTFDKGSFSRVPGNNVLFSSMDSGPTKKRVRSTLSKDTITGTILLKDNTEYATFTSWYNSTLNFGVDPFYFKDPVTAATIVVSFTESKVSRSHVGFEAYKVQMQMEIISE